MQSGRTDRIGRGGGRLAVLIGLLLGLLGAPASGAPYYEQSGPYCFGTGGACFGDPIDVATGAFLIRKQFGVIAGRVPIQLGWHFTSQDDTNGPLGKGTSLSYDFFLARSINPPDRYELYTPGNGHFLFDLTPNANGEFINSTDPEMLGATLTINGSPPALSSTLRWKTGEKFFFNSNGELFKVEDRHGNYVTIGRNSLGFPTVIYQQNVLRRITFSYNASNKLQSLTFQWDRTSANHRTWSFGYNSSGRLETITDPLGGVTRYTWTTYMRSDGRVLPLVDTVTNPRNIVETDNDYDSSGRVIKQTYADGKFLTVAYGAAIGQPGYTEVTDPNNNVTRYEFSWNLAPILFGYNIDSVTDALNRTTTFERDNLPTYLVTAIIDFRNRRTDLGWDARGNLTSVTQPTASGGTVTWSAAYHPTWNRLETITDPLNRVTTFAVDPANGNINAVTDARNFTTSFNYSSTNGDLLSVTNPLNHTTTYTYGSSVGELLTIKDPLNNQTVLGYDHATRLTSVKDANQKTVTLTYDKLDRITSTSQTLNGNTLTTVLSYDPNGNLRYLTDPKNQVWEWVYDSRDRVSQEKNPLLQVLAYEWDGNSNLKKRTDRLNQLWEYAYGPNDRLQQALFKRADGSTESSYTVNYNPTTHLIDSVVDSVAGTFSFGYDGIDRLTSEAGPAGTITHGYDDLDRRTSLQVSGQGLITYAFNALDDIQSITQNGLTATFEYDELARMKKRTLPNGVSTEWGFNPAGYLTSVVSKQGGTPFDSHTYQPDAVGNILQHTRNGVTDAFGYDDLYRLTSATVGGVSHAWSYDHVGNRLSQTVGGQTTSYTHDSANRLLTVNGVAVSHDANGNLTAFGGDTFSWDVRGRMVALTRPGLVAAFGYDYLGRRTSKALNGVATAFLHDGDDLVSEITGGTSVHTLHGPVLDEPLARNGLYFTPNHLGSTTTLTDGSGATVEQYSYRPFGETTAAVGVSNPFQYTGRENDGTGLMYYRARYYAPEWGRFVSEDPIGFLGGPNQYAYVGNNPATGNDPFGLFGPGRALWNLIMGFFSTRPAPGTPTLNSPSVDPQILDIPGVAEERGRFCVAGQAVAGYLEDTGSEMLAGAFFGTLGRAGGVARGARHPAVRAALNRGAQEHANFYIRMQALGMTTNRAIAGTNIRPDAIDFVNRVVYELKPNNPRAIALGRRQLQAYITAAQRAYGGHWRGQLVTY